MPISSSISRGARRKTVAGLALSALVLMGAGWYDDDYEQCRDGATAEIVQCLDRLTASWQARLDNAYETLLAAQDRPGRKAALERAQRQWAAYRKANCLVYRQGPGSIAAIEAAECMRVLTRRRALDLEQAAGGRPE